MNERRISRGICAPIVCRRLGRAALLVVLTLGVLQAFVGSAAAKIVHQQEGSFGPIENLVWVAIDNSTGSSAGDVYGSSLGFFTLPAVKKFNEDGTPTNVELNGAETPDGSFNFLDLSTFRASSGVAVDGSTGANAGHVYLPDIKHNVVDVFDESGTYICQITGKATPSVSECAGAAGSLTPTGGLIPISVAVNPANGELVVGDMGGSIYEFNEAGEYDGEISDPHVIEPGGLAFDSLGDLYVVNGSIFAGGGFGIKLNPSGNYVSTVAEKLFYDVAVDLGNDHVYFENEESGLSEYDAAGNHLVTFGGTSFSADTNRVSGQVYDSPFFEEGRIWSGDLHIPVVNTGAALNVENTTATVTGDVDPDGEGDVTSCEFEYGTTTAYGSAVPCAQLTPYAVATPVSAALTGLAAGTTYHFRLKAANANGVSSYGEDKTFLTKGPTVDSESVTGIGRFGATLEAGINPHGDATDYIFEYVTQKHFDEEGFIGAQTTAPEAIGSAGATVPVSKTVAGLLVGTKYHYRARASNIQGAKAGLDQTFETNPVATIVGQYPTAGMHTATLETEINPEGLDTSCHMQWVSDAQFQQSGYSGATTVPCSPEDLGSGSTPKEAKVELSNLALATTYHFRAIAENSSGILLGKDKLFSTFGIKEFSVKLLNKAGEPETRAGSHPAEYVTRIALNTNFVQGERASIAGLLKDVLTEAPPGLLSNPNATPKCTRRTVEENKCMGEAQLGTMRIGVFQGNPPRIEDETEGVFNTYPPKGKSASFTTTEFQNSFVAFFDMAVRGGDDAGVNSGVSNVTERATVYEVETTFWGTPADSSHDADRECAFVIGCVSNADPKPFLRMPTECAGPTTVKMSINSYGFPAEYSEARQELPAVTGCNQLEFEPAIEMRPTTKLADSPTGLHFDLHLPQNEDPEGLGTPDLKSGVITLPQGMTLNPAGANGLASCSPAQIDLHNSTVAHCPEASKVGSVTVDSPLVHFSVRAGLYLATPYDNPFGTPFALYMADPDNGAPIKLALRVDADPRTGRLTARFDEASQLAFDDFKVDLFSGALAPLRTPATCGIFTSTASLTPWSAPESGPPATPSDSYKISGGPNGSACTSSEGSRPNAPTFSAGTQAPIAGRYSPLAVNLSRGDGTQQFSALTMTAPPGLLAKIAGTTYCSDAALAAAAGKSGNAEVASPSCPSSSRIGSVVVGAGAGPAPYYAHGSAYLAGPYKGAPLSMAVVTPAVAGPFDFGTVVVRTALNVDPETARITAKTDQFPEMLRGVPLDIRSVTLKLDRPDFTLNPTSCDPMSVDAGLVSSVGQVGALSDRFQLGDCTNLPFKPTLETRLFGKTGRGGHPKLRATLGMPPGNANLASASLVLPPSVLLDRGHIRAVCTRVQFAAEACPAKAVYGHVVAKSPLLDEPLRGPLYLRSSDRKLPDLVADLRGQLHLVLTGRIDSVRGRIRASFDALPDAPISKLTLTVPGGPGGLLQNATDVCERTRNAVALLDGQNGQVDDLRSALKDSKCTAARPHHRHAKRPGA